MASDDALFPLQVYTISFNKSFHFAHIYKYTYIHIVTYTYRRKYVNVQIMILFYVVKM